MSLNVERHLLVLKLREEGMSLAEIAKQLGVTKERVRQIEAKALRLRRFGRL